MLFQALKRLIKNGQKDGMAEKLDIFFATNKLTAEEYNELTQMLGK